MDAIGSAIPISENDAVSRESPFEESSVVNLEQLLALSLGHCSPSFRRVVPAQRA